MSLKRTLVTLMAAGLVVAVAPVAAYADDVTVTGDYTVPEGTTIDGDLAVTGGYVHIYGTVEGNVTQHGPGSVWVTGTGVVEGNIVENDGGIVKVFVGGLVKGNITEHNGRALYHRQHPWDGRRERHPARTGHGEGGGVVAQRASGGRGARSSRTDRWHR